MQLRKGIGASVAHQPSAYGGGRGLGGASMPSYEEEDDRILCKFCGRKFAEQAGLRHIPHCEAKYKNEQMMSGPPRKA